MTSRVVFVSGILCGMFAMAPPASAQTTFGELAGRVIDAQGSGVPGATVTATNPATGFSRTTTSGSIGDYLLVQLPPGRYSVTAELSGFRRGVASDIRPVLGLIEDDADVRVPTQPEVQRQLGIHAPVRGSGFSNFRTNDTRAKARGEVLRRRLGVLDEVRLVEHDDRHRAGFPHRREVALQAPRVEIAG